MPFSDIKDTDWRFFYPLIELKEFFIERFTDFFDFNYVTMSKQNPVHNGDYKLWKNLKRGDYEAFNRIYTDNYPVLLAYGLKFKNDREFIKDCIQELFLDIIRRIHKLGDTDHIMFYLLASLRRKILRKIQYENVFRYDHNHLYLQNLQLADPAAEEKILHIDQQAANKQLIRSLIDQLPPREKEAVLLRFYFRMEYPEMATIMKLNVQSVRNLIYRAIKNLREKARLYSGQLRTAH